MQNKYNNVDELSLLFKRIFNTEDGRELYKVLEAKFRKPSLCPQAVADGMALLAITQMRVGEENVIRFIDSMINREVGKNDTSNDE